jgi:hypothetical protein
VYQGHALIALPNAERRFFENLLLVFSRKEVFLLEFRPSKNDVG